MSAPPPPSGPPAGWYPDPDGGSGHRWWDGSTWTETVDAPAVAPVTAGQDDLGAPAASPTQPAGWYPDPGGDTSLRWWDGSTWTAAVRSDGPEPNRSGPIGPVDRLVAETFRTSLNRAGHMLPLILVFMLSIGLASALLLWLGLSDTIVTFDENSAEAPVVDYGGSAPALFAYLILVPISLLGAAVVRAATARQIWAAQAGAPERWGQSLAGVARRWRPFLAGTMIRWLIYLVLGGGFVVAASFVPLLILAFPFVFVAMVLAWVRLSLVDQAAVLAPAGVRPLRTSWQVSGRQAWPLLLRLIVLALIALAAIVVIALIGSVVTAIAGAEATAPLDPDAMTYDLGAAMGDNLAMFVLSAAFGSLSLGAGHVLVSAGATLLYRNLDGPTADDLVAEATGQTEARPAWETGG